MAGAENPVLHVLVFGFHHKKGCQVEFSFPPLIEGNSVESHEVPEEWKHIASLALPDGAHNYTHDTVYFVLPGRKQDLTTVYGVSCYRQMDAKDLINKTADVTRSTVQKSVCVLSRLPLYGLIKAKLELITHAYFDERDFSQVSLLEQTFNTLNTSLNQSLLEGSQIFLGLSARELIQQYRHKLIILFKLLLLERRVLVFGSPVETLCHTLLGVVSLFPGMMESGLRQACNQWTKRKLSPTMGTASAGLSQDDSEEFLEIRYHSSEPQTPLEEVIGHIHNSAINLGASGDCDYTALDIAEDTTPSSEPVYLKEEPESPTIPRDAAKPAVERKSSGQSNSSRHKGAGQNIVSEIGRSSFYCPVEESSSEPKARSKSVDEGENEHSDKSTKAAKSTFFRSISSSSQESDKLSVHSSHRIRASVSEVDERGEELSGSPLEHVERITHIEAVQESAMETLDITEPVLPPDNNNDSDKGRDSALTLASTKPRSTDEMIEDLDSPESISKIDMEDCFSWEHDQVKLAIEHEFLREQERSPKRVLHLEDSSSRDSLSTSASESGKESSPSESTVSDQTHTDAQSRVNNKTDSPSTKEKKTRMIKNRLSAAFSKVGPKAKLKLEKEGDARKEIEGEILLPQDNSGYPLAIFTKGSVCYPYLSLQYHDMLTDVNIRSFLIGATNILFKQRRQLIDVVVETEEAKVEIRDRELQRQLSLTTADLRFSEYLVRIVTEEKPGHYDGTEWEGSDEWIRAQFRHYLNSLLSTVFVDDPKMLEDFGMPFVSAWKTTYNYRHWQESNHPAIKVFPPGHPFQGNLNMTDVRMRFNHSLQNSERGRKINAAVVQTGKYVVQTGKAVGGALTSARSAVSGWFSSWRGNDKTEIVEQEKTETETEESKNEGDSQVESVTSDQKDVEEEKKEEKDVAGGEDAK